MSRKKIAVLMASIDREYQQDFASGLASEAAKNDIDICIFNSQGHMNVAISTSEVGESRIYDLPDLNEFDGIISMPATMGNDLALKKVLALLEPLKGKPHVSIDTPIDGAVTIQFDDRISVEELTEHMLSEHGARRVAYVSGPFGAPVSEERVNAARKVLQRHGLSLEDRMLFDGEWTRVGGRRAAEQILQMGGELPDAVMCANDDMALSVIECFNENGIQVPRDVAVTGFDALRESVMRGLTTICRPIDRSARKAIEILCEWMDGNEPKEKTVTLSTIPIFGETCGCKQNIEHINDKLRLLGTERWNMETILTRVSMFSGTMAGVGDEAEAREKIRDFVQSWGIQELYLCVDPAICREVENQEHHNAYPNEMLLLYGYRNGKEYPSEVFPVFDLTPSMNQIRKDSVCLVFCPLYYRDRSFGYVAMNKGNGTGAALYPVLMLLNGTVMSLYLQTNIKKSAAVIERMANHDIMTGLLNRRGYMRLAPEKMEEARKNGKLFVLMSGDMNHMKDINDRYGHLAGDEAIVRMGKALEVVRNMGMIPVHISGDEFLAYGIMEHEDSAKEMIARINQKLDEMNKNDAWICDISASFGIHAAVPGEGDTIDKYMTLADRAMYENKNRTKYGRRKDDKKPFLHDEKQTG